MRWGFSAFNPPRRASRRCGCWARPACLPGARRLPAVDCKAPACPASCKATASSRATTSRWAMAARRADGAGALSRQRQPGRSRAGPGRPGQQWPAGAAGIGRQRHGLLPAWRRWRLERPPAVRRHPHPVRRQPGRDGGPERRRQGRPAVHGATELRHYPRMAPPLRAGAQRAAPRRLSAATANTEQTSVVFADVFGDGLSHRVQVRNGEWPCGPAATAVTASAAAGRRAVRRRDVRDPRLFRRRGRLRRRRHRLRRRRPSAGVPQPKRQRLFGRCACRCRCACRPPTRSRSPTSAATARPPS